MALTSLHWQQPYAHLKVSKNSLTPPERSGIPRFTGFDNFSSREHELQDTLIAKGHTAAWFMANFGARLWRMISHKGQLYLHMSPLETGTRPDKATQDEAKAQLAKSLEPLGTLILREASHERCCRGGCLGCVETKNSAHHDRWSLPVIATPDGTSPEEPRQES